MKNTIYIIKALIIGISMTLISSCKKDNNTSDIVEKLNPKTINYTIPWSNISCENGMLKFETMNDIEQTIEALDLFSIEYDSVFNENNSTLSGDELDDYADSVGHHHEQPMIDFENEFACYTSLRSHIETAELNFLQNEDPDWEQNPDNHFIVESAFRAVLNVDGKVKIGEVVYQFFEEGWQEDDVWVYNEDMELFGGYSKSHVPCFGSTQIICFKSNSTNTRIIKSSIGIVTLPWVRYVYAKTKNYRKITFFWWKPTKANTKSKVLGKVSSVAEPNCHSLQDFTQKIEDKKNVIKLKAKRNVPTKATDCSVKGEHTGGSISTDTELNKSSFCNLNCQ